MTDYGDHEVWTEVELYDHAEFLEEHNEYQPEDLLERSSKLLAVAKEQGLQGCYLKFKSTMDSYDDYLGPVVMTVCGYRKLNDKEKAERDKQNAVMALAAEKRIAFYEAATLLSLQERGKI